MKERFTHELSSLIPFGDLSSYRSNWPRTLKRHFYSADAKADIRTVLTTRPIRRNGLIYKADDPFRAVPRQTHVSDSGNCWIGFKTAPQSTPQPVFLVMLLTAMGASVLNLFAETGAYLRGHFHLSSGLHSGEYLQSAKVLSVPAYAERLGRELAFELQLLIPDVDTAPPHVVVSPAIGGIIIGHEVARALNIRFLFTEREAATGAMAFRRGFSVSSGEAALVVEDVITTGGSTKEVIRLIRAAGAHVLAVGSIIDRSGGKADLGVPRIALETLEAVSYNPDDCPLCREGAPLAKPGSRPD